MKLVSRIILLLLIAALGFGLGMYLVSLRAERENGLYQIRDLQARITQLLAEQKKLQDEGTRLKADLAAAGARVTAAENRYNEEHTTNEPLRRQVEQMMGRQIANDTALARQAGDLKTAQGALAVASERAEKLATENEATKSTIQGLEDSIRDKSAALTAMQAKLAAAQAQVATFEKTQAEWQAKTTAADAALADAKQKNAELTAALEALRKPNGTATPAPGPGR